MEKAEVTAENLQNIQQYVDFVKTNLEPLAQQLKVGVDWLWNVLVMQARVEAITMLVVCGLMGIVGVSLLASFIYNMKRAKWTSYGEAENANAIFTWAFGIAAGLMFIVNAIAIPSSVQTIVTGLVNPEYRAIEKIVEFAQPKVEEATEEKK